MGMKRVLVIGEKSYIGKSFKTFAKNRYELKMVNSRNQEWRSVDFTGYDSILYCAGIAHVSCSKKMRTYYNEVNCDLAVDVAKKAKSENVKQFIFISSILVYDIKNESKINGETMPNPVSIYGGSKHKAEQELQKLIDDNLKLCIIRSPMVYGKYCKGNFYKLAKLVKIMPFFPDYSNRRSMIFIDNLCNLFCKLIDNNERGVFLPQNNECVSTTELVCCIAKYYNKRIYKTKLFNPLICLLAKYIYIFEKMFSDLYYERSENEYNIVDFENSIRKSLDIFVR